MDICEQFLNALKYERAIDYEISQPKLPLKTLAATGRALLNFQVVNCEPLEFQPDASFHTNDFSCLDSDIGVGDIVAIIHPNKDINEGLIITGLVIKINKDGLTIKPSDLNVKFDFEQRISIVRLLNETPYKRMEQALSNAPLKSSKIIDLLLGKKKPIELPVNKIPIKINDEFVINSNLNKSQIDAIDYALTHDLTVIHGPPGTGKTRTIVEFIISFLKINPNKKILVTAGSNVAVDTILERLVSSGVKDILRVGERGKVLGKIGSGGDQLDIDYNENDQIKKKKKVKGISKSRHSKNRHKNNKNQEGEQEIEEIDTNLSPNEYRERIIELTHLPTLLSNELKPVFNDLNKDLKKLKRDVGKPGVKYSERKEIYKEMKLLKRERRVREEKSLRDLIRSSKVVLGTVVGIASNDIFYAIKDLKREKNENDKEQEGSAEEFFDTLIIDEVSQVLEPGCWIPIVSIGAENLVLAGDDKQLSAVVKCADGVDGDNFTKEMKKMGNLLKRSLFTRLLDLHKDHHYVKFLNVQYRMHQLIQKFSNEEWYGGNLQADASVRGHTLKDLMKTGKDEFELDVENDHVLQDMIDKLNLNENEKKELNNLPEDLFPIYFHDTAHNHLESKDSTTLSIYNSGEVLLALEHVIKLNSYGIASRDIGIIAPYSAQVSHLKNQIHLNFPGVEISTVDGFQGREKEIIILTMTRSNDESIIGFLNDERRLNVAITRAKRQLYVIADGEMFDNDKILNKWRHFLEESAQCGISM
ncbi:ATP-dependent 5'-3' DNA helicase [Martiniozyma asiatica (nom. inval.)]|nr:ATP-dependent 5'-3' DNA helicase [Martiniozyma asiatica]